MDGEPNDPSKPPATESRSERLARQLRANLQKRKAQARARRLGDSDRRPDGIEAARRGGENDPDA